MILANRILSTVIGAAVGFAIAGMIELVILVGLGDFLGPNLRPQGMSRLIAPLIGAGLGWQIVWFTGAERIRTLLAASFEHYRWIWVSTLMLGIASFLGFVLLNLLLWSGNELGPAD